VSDVSVKIPGAMAETVVLLHGFAGTRHGWDLVADRLDAERYTPLALDLRGHGGARDERPIDFEAVTADVAAAGPDRFVLCGYSLGGRVALHVALAHPERVSRLVLVASTAGIDDPLLRRERREADEKLAAELEQGTIEEFADRWMRQPLFAGTPPAAAAHWRADLLRNEPAALAAALRGIGAGVMQPLWDRLPDLTVPASIIVGERDGRYAAIGRRLAAALPDARLLLVPGAGHGLPREAPQAVAAAIATE
jgi:2-succinyl-6-hydroxy-2,4-cyclohexadiene-1-carboxylate synthase